MEKLQRAVNLGKGILWGILALVVGWIIVGIDLTMAQSRMTGGEAIALGLVIVFVAFLICMGIALDALDNLRAAQIRRDNHDEPPKGGYFSADNHSKIAIAVVAIALSMVASIIISQV